MEIKQQTKFTEYKTVFGKGCVENIPVAEYSVNSPFFSPDEMAYVMNEAFHLNKLTEEYVFMAAVDDNLEILGMYEISHGGYRKTTLTTREILLKTVSIGATGVILFHNHPSGTTSFSKGDVDTTDLVLKALKLAGLVLIDHILIAKDNCLSMSAMGYLHSDGCYKKEKREG